MTGDALVMDQNDPQQRIAEPEAYNDSHKSGRAWDFKNLWNSLVMAFLVVTLGICAVTYGALTPYGYWVGTPTKAAVDHCELHGLSSLDSSPELNCTGTWSVRGQSQTGPIKPPFHDNEQNGIRPGKSVVDVRVHNGTAYTALSVGKGFYLALALGAGFLVWGSLRLRKAWRARNRS
jgi:hypothetical protein